MGVGSGWYALAGWGGGLCSAWKLLGAKSWFWLGRFTVREFYYDENEIKRERDEMTRLLSDKKQQYVSTAPHPSPQPVPGAHHCNGVQAPPHWGCQSGVPGRGGQEGYRSAEVPRVLAPSMEGGAWRCCLGYGWMVGLAV